MIRRIPLIGLLVLLLLSCKTTKQNNVEYIHLYSIDTLREVQLKVDSVVLRDSIVTFIKGDTIQIEKWHTAFRERLRVDTVEKVRVQTVYQTKTVENVKEVNRLKWWQKSLMWIGAVSLLIFTTLIFLRIKNR